MFIEQAYKGDNALWKVLITTALTTGIFVVNMIVFFLLPSETTDEMYETMKNMPKLVAMVGNLVPFIFLLGLLFLLVRFLHQRSILSLTTSRPRVDYGRVLFAFTVVVVFTVGLFAISYQVDSSHIEYNFQPVKFAILLVLSLLLFPIQIGFEEYLFRGYLMQQIGIASLSRFVPLVVTSVFFGLFHSANPEVNELGYGVMSFYIGTGFLLGVIALMDEGIELTLGYHLANNLMAVLLISSDYAAIQSDAVFRLTEKAAPEDTLGEMVVTMLISYPLILLIFAWKYKWRDWKGKLFGKVAPQPVNVEPTTHFHP
ncbi:CPBP family intramembrane glutamic endopeptidase [Flavobacterium sp.]|uniref:CPBP family intramembrane glutamic endopeptidase n=1 Tax=Flavobacterium sp. TaxID=239 RepID=UPI00120C3BCD|nr:CPBP family intramembrane glutamic endopeptidase [Flavobacterium sp.]RZJ72855.1 MAG: CPBP family intramembrane metalloprotease [Flavobacterium sp.]